MSPNPHQPRPQRPRRRRDPRTRFQTVVRPEEAAGAATESSPEQSSRPSPSPTSPRPEETGGTILYPYILSDLKLSTALMAGVIALVIVLWIVLR